MSPVFKQGMYLGEIKEGRKKRDPGNEVDGNADSDIWKFCVLSARIWDLFWASDLNRKFLLLPLVRFFYNTQMESSYFSI